MCFSHTKMSLQLKPNKKRKSAKTKVKDGSTASDEDPMATKRTQPAASANVVSPLKSTGIRPVITRPKTEADSWPAGEVGWDRVLNSIEFFSLIDAGGTSAGSASLNAAIQFANRVGVGNIDCSRIYVVRTRAQTSYLGIWLTWASYDLGSNREPYRLTLSLYDIFRRGGARFENERVHRDPTAMASALESVIMMKRDGAGAHAMAILKEMSTVRGFVPTLRSILISIPHKSLCVDLDADPQTRLSSDQSVTCRLISCIPRDGSDAAYNALNGNGFSLLKAGIDFGAIHVVGSLLRHLPVLELDTWIAEPVDKLQSSGDKLAACAEGPEYWVKVWRRGREAWLQHGDSSTYTVHSVDWHKDIPNQIEVMIDAARQRMEVYRRERSELVRTLLDESIPYDLFDLIDEYGATPPRKQLVLVVEPPRPIFASNMIHKSSRA
jgi:hypothetical protein